MATRKEFVEAALGCMGTPFHHQGRLKGVGIDCAGLVIVAAKECGIEVTDMKGYSRIPDGRALLAHCESQNAERVSMKDAAAGDVILMKLERDPQHVAIIEEIEGDRVRVVHAWMAAKGVTRTDFDASLKDKVVAVYRLGGFD